MSNPEQLKRNTAIHAARLVKDGMVIGLGTGSTVYWLIQELGAKVAAGLRIMVVPTSEETSRLATKAGLRLADLNSIEQLPLAIDGADEIDPRGQMIKGGGGALLQEKIVASAAAKLVIIADSRKLVRQLGNFPLAVEVIPFNYKHVSRKIMQTGLCKYVELRQKDDRPFVTDHHHYILDCHFEKIADASALDIFLHGIPGVVETGLFLGMATSAIIGLANGRTEEWKFKKTV